MFDIISWALCCVSSWKFSPLSYCERVAPVGGPDIQRGLGYNMCLQWQMNFTVPSDIEWVPSISGLSDAMKMSE
jgi:hypothetical protein